MTSTETASIVLRDIDSVSDMHQVEVLEKEIWGCDDLDVLPATMLSASREVGGVLVGAYNDQSLVGFVYGFPALEDGEVTHHSHMLAVKPSQRNLNLGYRLKLAQRDRVLAQNIKRITWTFDPLQSLNAYFNFNKLGVVANKYKVNFYGESTTSFLHQFGTDRLWVSWMIQSDRVTRRLNNQGSESSFTSELPRLVQVRNNEPVASQPLEIAGEPRVAIEIPSDINALQQKDPGLAMRWREITREAFSAAISSGYLVQDFFRGQRAEESFGIYVLSAHTTLADVD
ncbi:MAG TPA: GNAT family N-acetyltransferase [Pyrinomonadaceae bacterium]